MGRPIPTSTPQMTHHFVFIPPVAVALPATSASSCSPTTPAPLAAAAAEAAGSPALALAGDVRGGAEEPAAEALPGGAAGGVVPDAAALKSQLPPAAVAVQMAAMEPVAAAAHGRG